MLGKLVRWALASAALMALMTGAQGEETPELRAGVNDPAAPSRFAEAPIGYSIEYESRRPAHQFHSRGKLTLTKRSGGRLYLTLDAVNELDADSENGLAAAVARGDVELLEGASGERVIRTRFVADLSGRMIEGGTIFGVERYAPHSCDFVEGLCRFTRTLASGRTLYLHRRSHFDEGVWRYSIGYDPTRDPEGRKGVVYEGEVSVGADGWPIDEFQWRKGRVQTIWRRTSPTP